MNEQELISKFYDDIKEEPQIVISKYMHAPPEEGDRTFPEWIALLPCEYRSRALKSRCEVDTRSNYKYSTLEESLRQAMDSWYMSAEGNEFWEAVACWGQVGYGTLPEIP